MIFLSRVVVYKHKSLLNVISFYMCNLFTTVQNLGVNNIFSLRNIFFQQGYVKLVRNDSMK